MGKRGKWIIVVVIRAWKGVQQAQAPICNKRVLMMMRDVEKRGCVRKRGDGVDVAIIAIVVVVGYY